MNDQAVNRLAIYKRKKSIDRKKYVCYYFSLHNNKVPKLNVNNVVWLNGVSDIVSDSLMTRNVRNMLGLDQHLNHHGLAVPKLPQRQHPQVSPASPLAASP